MGAARRCAGRARPRLGASVRPPRYEGERPGVVVTARRQRPARRRHRPRRWPRRHRPGCPRCRPFLPRCCPPCRPALRPPPSHRFLPRYPRFRLRRRLPRPRRRPLRRSAASSRRTPIRRRRCADRRRPGRCRRTRGTRPGRATRPPPGAPLSLGPRQRHAGSARSTAWAHSKDGTRGDEKSCLTSDHAERTFNAWARSSASLFQACRSAESRSAVPWSGVSQRPLSEWPYPRGTHGRACLASRRQR